MTLQNIYNLINHISNKHHSGRAFNLSTYNLYLELSYKDFFKKKLLDRKVPMDEFVVNETLTVGSPFTYDYAYWKTGTETVTNNRIEFVAEDEYSDRLDDSIMLPSASAPVAFERAGVVVIKPDTVTSVNVSYFRYPEKPFCDYYIDVNGEIQFLDVGDVHTWVDDEIDSAGTTHHAGDADWDSLTTELEFNEDLHLEYVLTIISMAGIKLDKIQLTQYAEEIQKK